jgi:DNA-binding LytR/AlgR family response regulator
MAPGKRYKCIVVDDEALARMLIETHLLQVPDLELVCSCSSAIEASEYLRTNKIDLIFLDIQMPGLTGMEFLKSVVDPPKVIFTTAYSEFALDGYELNVIDYLLKPIVFDRFLKAANKAIRVLNLESQVSEPATVSVGEKSMVIKSSHQLVKIDMEDILYVEGLHKYVKIVTRQKNFTTLFGLTKMEHVLPNDKFYRCHRSFIINLGKVSLIDGNEAVIENVRVPVSRNNKEELVDKLGKNLW